MLHDHLAIARAWVVVAVHAFVIDLENRFLLLDMVSLHHGFLSVQSFRLNMMLFVAYEAYRGLVLLFLDLNKGRKLKDFLNSERPELDPPQIVDCSIMLLVKSLYLLLH